jgi:pyridinium-3,5-bisthiocarboxylic acid mononucleotide nickel chelatase
MTVRAVGTGGGGRDTPDRPNITRVVIGASGAEPDLREGDVTVVESTVDDLDPRLWPSVLQACGRAANGTAGAPRSSAGTAARAGPHRPVR